MRAAPPALSAAVSWSSNMRTGRLLKFPRPAGDIHAYLYRDGRVIRAAVYVMSSTRSGNAEPIHTISGASEARVEEAVRAWVDAHYPKRR
jgi:hypothetical protein